MGGHAEVVADAEPFEEPMPGLGVVRGVPLGEQPGDRLAVHPQPFPQVGQEVGGPMPDDTRPLGVRGDLDPSRGEVEEQPG